MQLQYRVVFSFQTTCFSLFNSVAILRDSKQTSKNLFLCLLSVWFRATANRQVVTKFPICVSDVFCFWLKMDINGSLLCASNCENGLLASSCLSVCLYAWTEFYEIWYLNIFRKSLKKAQVSRKSDKKNGF